MSEQCHWVIEDRKGCEQIIEGKVVHVPGVWRHRCRRDAEPGTERCWQHRKAG